MWQLFLLVVGVSSLSASLLVELPLGKVWGESRQGFDPTGTPVNWTSFAGIPFAQPPVGKLRFLPPQPPNSTEQRPPVMCPQVGGATGLLDGSDEDCLQLNVYVPEASRGAEDPLPVMVWIHGGGFLSGDGRPESFGPQYLMASGVVVVTINYRLSTLGFLSLGTEEVPGNMGMLDQVAALRWVQENIASFGGDPAKVTIFGQSAGSMSCSYHLYSPISRGLFQRAILQSGVGGFAPSFHHHTAEQAAKYGRDAANLLGCNDPDRRADCLRSKSLFQLLATELPTELMSQPCLDGDLAAAPFLPLHPIAAVKYGQHAKEVDIMVGFNEDEGLLITEFFLQAPHLYDVVRQLWPVLGPYSLLGVHSSEATTDIVNLATDLVTAYAGGLENLAPDHFANVTELYTDSFFWYAASLFLEYHLPWAEGTNYQYRFSYFGQYHRVHAPGLHHDNAPGVTHSDELYFLWNPFWSEDYPLNPEDSLMSSTLVQMWTNFARTGNPTPEDSPVSWDSVRPDQPKYLRIDREGSAFMELSPDYVERMNLWRDLIGDWPPVFHQAFH